MNIADLSIAINNLSTQRTAFWSEADFQFSLAWALQRLLPQSKIYLERRALIGGKACYIDIWVEDNGYIYPIELKYKTKRDKLGVVELKNQSAVDFGCYDYLYDVHRLEQLKQQKMYNLDKGWAVMLTNEPLYYNNTNRPSAYDNFKIYQGAVRGGFLSWGMTSKGIPFNYDKRYNFSIVGTYTMNWGTYNNQGFRYLISEIA